MAGETEETDAKARRRIVQLVLIFTVMFALYIDLFSGNPSLILQLGHEDGPIESLGAACFLAAALLFFVRYFLKADGLDLRFLKIRRNPFVLALALLCFLFFGEEISWGQRIFHFKTPESIARANVQKEFNLHNLVFIDGHATDPSKFPQLVTSRGLFFLFGAGNLFLIPLLTKNRKILLWASRLNFPIAPLYTGVFFILNKFVAQFIAVYLERTYPANRRLWNMASESKETFAAILFVVAALAILQQARKPSETGQSEPKAEL